MEPSDLPKIWGAPDHSRLTPKQISIRLPIKIAAQLSALSDIFPSKSKTEIISDLLASALDQLEKSLPCEGYGPVIHVDEDGEDIHEGYRGPLIEFRSKTKIYLEELEKELGMYPVTHSDSIINDPKSVQKGNECTKSKQIKQKSKKKK